MNILDYIAVNEFDNQLTGEKELYLTMRYGYCESKDSMDEYNIVKKLGIRVNQDQSIEMAKSNMILCLGKNIKENKIAICHPYVNKILLVNPDDLNQCKEVKIKLSGSKFILPVINLNIDFAHNVKENGNYQDNQ